MSSVKLSPLDWIAAAFRGLAEEGISGTKVERVARRLEVSKGSFYWHFADAQALRMAMLAHWESHATADILHAVETGGGSARDKIERLIDLATSDLADPYGGLGTEVAIREWSRVDPQAKAAQAGVDAGRMLYLAGLMQETGLDADRAQQSARIFLATYVGALHLGRATPAEIAKDLRRLLGVVLS